MSFSNNPFLKNTKFGKANSAVIVDNSKPTEDLSTTYKKICKLQSILKEELVTKEQCKKIYI